MRTGGVVAVMLLMLSSAARGATLDVGARTGARVNSNITQEEGDTTSGLGFDFGPTFQLTDDRHDLSYRLVYDADLLVFVNDSDGDLVNQRARGTLSYDLNPQTRITASDIFSWREGLGKAFASEPDELQLGTSRTIRNAFTTDLSYLFAPDLIGRVDFSNLIFDVDNDELNDSVTWSGGGNLTWVLSPRQRAGTGFSFTRQDFDDARGSPGAITDFYQGTAFWDYRIDPTWTVALSLGPTWVDDDTNNLGPFPGRSDTRLTLLGSARLAKTFARGSASLLYSRSESTTSGLGTSSIRDRVALNATWRPWPRWDFGFTTGYTRNKSSTSQDVNDIDIERYDVYLDFRYRFAPQWSLFGSASYLNQDRKGSTSIASEGTLERVIGRLGIRYSFRSIYF